MDYDKQRAFLRRQRLRLAPAALGCALLAVEAVRTPTPIAERLAATALAGGLLWAAYYLPNYLGLDAAAIRRPRWVARARWFVLLLTAMVVATVFFDKYADATAFARVALTAVLVAAGLHLALVRILRKPVPNDLREANPTRLVALAVVYAAGDFALLWIMRGPPGFHLYAPHGLSPVLLAELLAAFTFLAIVLLRPQSLGAQLISGVSAAGLSYWLVPAPLASAAVFLWVAGVAHLYAKAVAQNRRNYEDLVGNLMAFTGEPRETVVQMMAESVARLAEDWHRSKPQGQEAVSAWYSRNARLYLYANCQHHLLYKHIVYTLGLLRLARGRVLDFGGGPGNFSRALARAGFDTTYLDVPGESANYLRWHAERERLPLRIVHELSDLAGPYDVIYALDVIEHLVELPPVFERWLGLLSPGGLLVATYYNGPNRTAPMHIDPGYDAKGYLLAHGFRDVKASRVGLFSAELLRKAHFMILAKA